MKKLPLSHELVQEHRWEKRHTFLTFEIINFYPSISENLLDEAITWTKELTPIPDQRITIIKHARKSVLFNGDETWIKKFHQQHIRRNYRKLRRLWGLLVDRLIHFARTREKIWKTKRSVIRRRRADIAKESQSKASRQSKKRFGKSLQTIWLKNYHGIQPTNCEFFGHNTQLIRL